MISRPIAFASAMSLTRRRGRARRPPIRPSSSGAGRPRTAGRRCGRRAGGGGRRSDASPGRSSPTGRSGRSLQPLDMSWFRHQRRTRSPDRRQRARVRCGCSCRCCCCPGPPGENFCAAKLTSLVAFEQLKIPTGARRAPAVGRHRSRGVRRRSGRAPRPRWPGGARRPSRRARGDGSGERTSSARVLRASGRSATLARRLEHRRPRRPTLPSVRLDRLVRTAS